MGLKADGHTYAQDAINRGAKVLVAQRKIYLADATDVTVVIVSDSRKALARIADRFCDHPSGAFRLVGITGTNGKTTTTYLVEHIGRLAGMKTGVIGTVGIRVGDEKLPSEHTTPESWDLQRLFSRMRERNVDMVAMEVSSHALDLDRVWATQFAVTAFSNLTQDHLDYHKTFEAYFEAKARLFSRDYPAKRVICIDDEWGKKLLARCSQREESIITTGFTKEAQIHPLSVEYFQTHTKVRLEVRGSQYDLDYPLVGRFNVSNIMLALGIGIQNLPEGAAISLPLRQEGSSRGRAFLLGTLSGSVEPIFGILVVLVAAGVRPLMPWLLSFAAGAMLYVVVEELVPQAHSKAGTCGFVGGFLIMMILDVALG